MGLSVYFFFRGPNRLRSRIRDGESPASTNSLRYYGYRDEVESRKSEDAILVFALMNDRRQNFIVYGEAAIARHNHFC
jgi:hypothetical protein